METARSAALTWPALPHRECYMSVVGPSTRILPLRRKRFISMSIWAKVIRPIQATHDRTYKQPTITTSCPTRDLTWLFLCQRELIESLSMLSTLGLVTIRPSGTDMSMYQALIPWAVWILPLARHRVRSG